MFNRNRAVPTWERYRSFAGWSMMYCHDRELYAVVPPGHDPTDREAFVSLHHEDVEARFLCEAHKVIQKYAEDGKVAYIESGRDCDCVEYSGRVHIVDATFDAYLELDREIGEWADGPYRLELACPSEAKTVKYESRDLVLEAMEEGHPHHIVSSFA